MKQYNGFSPEQRNRAGAWLREQWAKGLPRPSKCCVCGQTRGTIDAHAEDYSEPFGPHIYQYPLCFRCHMMVHCRFHGRDAWERYKRSLRRGLIYKPIYSRDFSIIKAYLEGAIPEVTTGPERLDLGMFDKLKP